MAPARRRLFHHALSDDFCIGCGGSFVNSARNSFNVNRGLQFGRDSLVDGLGFSIDPTVDNDEQPGDLPSSIGGWLGCDNAHEAARRRMAGKEDADGLDL